MSTAQTDIRIMIRPYAAGLRFTRVYTKKIIYTFLKRIFIKCKQFTICLRRKKGVSKQTQIAVVHKKQGNCRPTSVRGGSTVLLPNQFISNIPFMFVYYPLFSFFT